MKVADDSEWRSFYVLLDDIRMPLFTVLSGYVYAMRPVTQFGRIPQMLRGKARRLLVPLLTVGTFFYVVQAYTPGTNRPPPLENIWHVYIYGHGHFWFLLSLFSIFAITGVLTSLRAFSNPAVWVLTLVATATIFVIADHVGVGNLFSFQGTLQLLPFFLLGYGLFTFSAVLPWKALVCASVLTAIVLITVKASLLVRGVEDPSSFSPVSSLLLGAAVIISLMACRKAIHVGWLAWIGQFSFGIYLLHVFGTAGARIILDRAGVEEPALVFTIGLLTGIALPLAFEVACGRYGIVSWPVLGQKPGRPKPLASSRDTADVTHR